MTASSSSAAAAVGAVLNGRWKLVGLLGEGGMGAVYEAHGVRGEGKRAIKMLHPEFIGDSAVLERFYGEAETSRGLAHPNIAEVMESATAEDGSPYLVMALLEGLPLARHMQRERAIPGPQAVAILSGVLRALGAAHARRIVHRDLKPDNVFLVPDLHGGFEAKVLDFGIAKVMDAAGGMGGKTRTGMLLGTPGYMSPEQIRSPKYVDARSDLWSAAVMFYEMLASAQPFTADNEFAKLTAVMTEPPRPIEAVAPHLAAWSPFFRRALANDPAERFQTAEDMAHALALAAQAVAAAAAPPAAYVPTAPSMPLVQVPTHVSAERPPGMPPAVSRAPAIAIIDASSGRAGAKWWLVGVIAIACLGLGLAAGLLLSG